MVIRIFRARLTSGARAAYIRLCYETSIPLMQGAPGCRAAYIAPTRPDRADDFIVVSVWDDLAAVRAYVGDDWEQPILVPGEASLLEWARVEHYDGAFHSLVRLWQAHADVMRRREDSARNATITDRQWEALKDSLPAQPRRGRPRADDRRTLDGVLYVLRNGCRWEDMPRTFGSAVTCWRRFSRWEADGTWERIWRTLWDELAPGERHVWAAALVECGFVPRKVGRRTRLAQAAG